MTDPVRATTNNYPPLPTHSPTDDPLLDELRRIAAIVDHMPEPSPEPEPEVIPVWVQPTGAHDAYQIGDRVHYPGESDPVYESLINGNVWSPDAYPAGWKQVQE